MNAYNSDFSPSSIRDSGRNLQYPHNWGAENQEVGETPGSGPSIPRDCWDGGSQAHSSTSKKVIISSNCPVEGLHRYIPVSPSLQSNLPVVRESDMK